MKTQCPECNEKFSVPHEMAGRTVKCLHCKNSFEAVFFEGIVISKTIRIIFLSTILVIGAMGFCLGTLMTSGTRADREQIITNYEEKLVTLKRKNQAEINTLKSKIQMKQATKDRIRKAREERIRQNQKDIALREKQKAETLKARKWYQGGTLHRAGILTWQNSSYENKLATCADFISGLWSTQELNPEIQNSIRTIEDILPYAAGLVTCIDTAIKKPSDPKFNRFLHTNQTVAEVATICMIIIEYILVDNN